MIARSKDAIPPVFRSAVAELGRILIYEACNGWLPVVERHIETPLAIAECRCVDYEKPVKVSCSAVLALFSMYTGVCQNIPWLQKAPPLLTCQILCEYCLSLSSELIADASLMSQNVFLQTFPFSLRQTVLCSRVFTVLTSCYQPAKALGSCPSGLLQVASKVLALMGSNAGHSNPEGWVGIAWSCFNDTPSIANFPCGLREKRGDIAGLPIHLTNTHQKSAEPGS